MAKVNRLLLIGIYVFRAIYTYILTALDESGGMLLGRILGPMKGNGTYRIRHNNM
jgi:hypothetical protein